MTASNVKINVTDLSWKTWFMIITILLSATAAGYVGVQTSLSIDFNARVIQALEQEINSTISMLEKPCSYLVGIFEGYTYMANGSNSQITFFSSNASAVINNAIGNMTNGGSLFMSDGSFTFTSPIVYTGEHLHIFMSSGAVLTNNVADYLFKFGVNWPIKNDIFIDGGQIQGTASSKGFILFNGVKNCYVRNVLMSGLVVLDSYAVNFTGSWENTLDGCTIWNVQNAVWIGASSGRIYLHRCYLDAFDYGSLGTVANYELNIDYGSASCDVVEFEGHVSSSVGIQIGWIGGLEATNCNFEGNTHLLEINATDAGMNYVNTITDCGKLNASAINIPSTNKANFIWKGTGFENSVSGTNTTSTTAVINHGLASNANYAFCYFNDSAITGYTVTSTSTQITVTIAGTPTGNWTCYAKVEYIP